MSQAYMPATDHSNQEKKACMKKIENAIRRVTKKSYYSWRYEGIVGEGKEESMWFGDKELKRESASYFFFKEKFYNKGYEKKNT